MASTFNSRCTSATSCITADSPESTISWEWNAGLLHLRGRLEGLFLNAVRSDVGEIEAGATAAAEL